LPGVVRKEPHPKTLLSTLHALFRKELSDQQLAVLFAEMCNRGIVKTDGAKVTYVLPTEQDDVPH
jgi:hypothetical protein